MASTATANPTARGAFRTAPWDLAGLCIVAALGAWTLASASGRPEARPLPVLALLVAAGALFGAGRVVAHRQRALVPGLLAVAVAGAFVLTFPGILQAGGAPTGYANTNGTLAALGSVVATAAASATYGATRRAWLGLALLLVVCTVLSESVAAGAVLAVVAGMALVSVARRDASVATLGGLVVTWIALGGTSALAAGSPAGRLQEQNAVRTDLWARAVDLARSSPLRGHGPGSFAPRVPATIDADLRWAHHEFLQQAAELGFVGMLLLLALVVWIYAYLWWGRDRGLASTVAGASAVTVVAVHATVDHVLHTPVVPLTLAVLAGWATADRRAQGNPGSPLRPR